jgi:hypothetical protein
VVVLSLAAGCIFLEEVNYAPEVEVVPVQGGPYYRGMQIQASAETRDRNAPDTQALTLEWSLTDTAGQPIGASQALDCSAGLGGMGCFVPHALGVTYRLTVTATDERGAKATDSADFTVENRPPAAAIRALGKQNANQHWPLHGEIRFSAYESTDPDQDDVCRLAYAFETVSRPLASSKDVFVEQGCEPGDFPPACQIETPAWCIRPDAAGTYRVRVTVTDPGGAADTTEMDVEVDPDGVPCLAQFVPVPIDQIFIGRSEGALSFGVNVIDDLDPWPPTGANKTGFPAFTWSLQAAGDPEFVPIPDYAGNHYELDLTAFSAGEEVQVRVELADRVDRPETRGCDADAATCPPFDYPLPASACVQRVTWKLEVY